METAIISWRWANIFSVMLMVFAIAFVATFGVKAARGLGKGKDA